MQEERMRRWRGRGECRQKEGDDRCEKGKRKRKAGEGRKSGGWDKKTERKKGIQAARK